MDTRLLLKLMETDGVSGREEAVSRLISKHLKKYVNKVYSDKVGNLIAVKKGKGPKIMLAAHMDEVGLIVKTIDADGLVGLAEIGGLNIPSIINQRVEIVGKTRVPGVISTRSISNDWDFDRDKTLIMHDLFVDTGLGKKELEKKGVMIGSTVVLKQHNGFLANNTIAYGKALDDRTGCFILCELAKQLKGMPNEIILVFTVQEEVGLYGAKVSVYNLEPDYCLVVDTSNANDRMNETPTKVLGKGPVLTIMDVEMLGNRKMNEKIEALAKKKKIPIQPEVSSAGTTDALSIAFSKGGIPTSMFGVCVRNLHTTVGMSHLDDIENCIQLLAEFLKEKHSF